MKKVSEEYSLWFGNICYVVGLMVMVITVFIIIFLMTVIGGLR